MKGTIMLLPSYFASPDWLLILAAGIAVGVVSVGIGLLIGYVLCR